MGQNKFIRRKGEEAERQARSEFMGIKHRPYINSKHKLSGLAKQIGSYHPIILVS